MLGSLGKLSSITSFAKRILAVYTVFTLFEVIVTSECEPEEIGFIVKALMQRSTITTAGVSTGHPRILYSRLNSKSDSNPNQ
ncbi:hypothetical protein DL96DRAFT_1812590, partial [Flagelloscypha sp. PMI_526]